MVARITIAEYIVFIPVLVLFVLSAGKYYASEIHRVEAFGHTAAAQFNKFQSVGYSEDKSDIELVFIDDEWVIREDDKVNDDYIVENVLGFVAITAPEATRHKLEIEGVNTFYSSDNTIHTTIPFNAYRTSFPIQVQEDYVPIFGYHDIVRDDSIIRRPTLQIFEKDFERQIAYASENMHCYWITTGELAEYILNEEKTPKNACVINFDDGNSSDYTYALPIMERYGVIGTFYVIPGRLEESTQYMTWPQVDALYLAGNEIASHTYNSGSLTESNLNYSEIIYQVERSKDILERRYGEVTTFAYPLGDWDENIIEALKETDYLAARDTSVDNVWKDRRTPTVSFADDLKWHIHYHKPELDINIEDLERSLGYTSWWQFEEGYRADTEIAENIALLSSFKPTETSFGVLRLNGKDDGITNKFIIRDEGTYTLTMLLNTNRTSSESTPVIEVNNSHVSPSIPDRSTCIDELGIHFCYYEATVSLQEGVNTISVSSDLGRVYADKFSIKRTHKAQSSFQIEATRFDLENDLDIKSFIPGILN